LDADPEAALQHQEVRTFVQELALTGFIGLVHILGDPSRVLPAWLQNDFLRQHNIGPLEKLSDAERDEVDNLFTTATQGLRFDETEHGRYFRFPDAPRGAQETRQFKYYVERGELLALLRNDGLNPVLEELQQQHVSPHSMKLSEDEFLVLYFDEAKHNAGEQVRNVFGGYGIAGRGPAQDVFQVTQNEGQLAVDVFTSNDGALGDGGHNPIEYTARIYDARSFVDSYLRLCLYAGKDPSEPYKTNFVYLVSPDAPTLDPTVIAEASRFVDYPVVASTSRRALSLTA
jgi:hypothetical protein